MNKDIVVKTYLSVKEKMYWKRVCKNLDMVYDRVRQQCDIQPLTPPLRKQVQDYWRPLVGEEVNTKWHAMIKSYTGHFDPRYEPFEICSKVQHSLSPREFSAFDDKGLYRSLMMGFNFAERVAECSYGVCYLPQQSGWKEVKMADVVKALQNVDDCIIKPARLSSGGMGVKSFATKDGREQHKGEAVEEVLKRYKGNFLVEKKIHEHENLQALNQSSCNTLRVHTYRNREAEQVRYISSHVRIGKEGSVVDNMDAGGVCAMIHADGCLHGAVSIWPYVQFDKSPSGMDISNYKIDGWEKIKQTCIDAHSMLPMYGLVGWDAVMDQAGRVVFIEFNPNPDMRMEQCIYKGSCLAEHQEDVMRQVFGRR